MSSSNCPHFYYWILTGITDGHPSGVDLVLLSFTPDKTGAIGWPALRAGYFISIIAIWNYTGLLEEQPPGLVVLLALSPSGITRVYWKNNPQGWLPYCHYRHVPGLQEDRDRIGISDTGGVILQ